MQSKSVEKGTPTIYPFLSIYKKFKPTSILWRIFLANQSYNLSFFFPDNLLDLILSQNQKEF